jgi:hypothetical protein
MANSYSSTFSLDASDLRKLASDLQKVAKKALPYAAKDALNRAAFEGRKQWGEQMDKAFVLRNKWTKGSIRVEKASGIRVDGMASKLGSALPYLEKQEEGGAKTPKGAARSVPIPTSSAAGQGMKAPRTKQVSKRNWQSAIDLAGRGTGSRQRRNAVAVLMALKSGSGVAFLDLGKGDAPKKQRKRKGVMPPTRKARSQKKGLFRVTGSPGHIKVRMIWDMTRKTIAIKPRPTLEPTVEWVVSKAPEWQRDALIEQLRRHKVVGY